MQASSIAATALTGTPAHIPTQAPAPTSDWACTMARTPRGAPSSARCLPWDTTPAPHHQHQRRHQLQPLHRPLRRRQSVKGGPKLGLPLRPTVEGIGWSLAWASRCAHGACAQALLTCISSPCAAAHRAARELPAPAWPLWLLWGSVAGNSGLRRPAGIPPVHCCSARGSVLRKSCSKMPHRGPVGSRNSCRILPLHTASLQGVMGSVDPSEHCRTTRG